MLTYTAQGLWDHKQQKLHINVLEMLAVLKALEIWETKLLETRILIATDSPRLFEQSGGDTQLHAEHDSSTDTIQGGFYEIHHQGSPCVRGKERVGRSPVQTGGSDLHGMEAEANNIPGFSEEVGHSPHRLICNKPKLSITSVLLP